VYAVADRAPVGGIEAAGWRVGFADHAGPAQRAEELVKERTDVRHSLGFAVRRRDDAVILLVPNRPAAAAGVAPRMQLVRVNGRKYTPDRLREAIRDSKKRPVELIVASGEELKTLTLRYDGGERYPRLERVAGKPDLLSPIIAPHTK